MDDRELNEKLGKLCGKVLVESNASGRWLLVNPPGGCLTAWNPVNDWGQAMRYVVAAIVARGGIGFFLLHDDDGYEVSFNRQLFEDDLPSRKVASFDEVPRAICVIALEAAKALEATSD